jgi:hypothetical protein
VADRREEPVELPPEAVRTMVEAADSESVVEHLS